MAKMNVLVIFMIIAVATAKLVSEDEVEDLFKKFVKKQLTEEETRTLNDVFDILQMPEYVSARSLSSNPGRNRMSFDCLICRAAFGALFDGVAEGRTDEDISESITVLCTSLGIESYIVCKGAVGLNIPIITHIIKTTPQAHPRTFCSLVLQAASDPNVCINDDPRFEWQVDLPERINYDPPVTDSTPLTVALITDAHLDPLYEPNGAAECGEPTCCRKGQTVSQTLKKHSSFDESIYEQTILHKDDEILLDLTVAPKIREMRALAETRVKPTSAPAGAGYWGDYRDCDTPLWAFYDVIDRIAETHKNVDMVYYIGDTIDHFVWETTYELINDMNRRLIDKMRSSFGDHVMVVPVIGNHEAQPTNQFAPASVTGDKLNTTWLYKALAEKWAFYLPEDAKKTVLERGEYSIRVRPGLKVITLNNNVAYTFNWWLVYDPTDAKKHLDWLVDELYEAELVGDKVHIVTHIPPGVSDLTHTWTREYNRIINRFASTITGEFTGHTHSDEFKIFYGPDGSAVSVAWGAGSATSYANYNLNYKIATFDTTTLEPTNIVNYVYNLTEANLTPNRRPHWFQLYDLKQRFQLTDLSPASMNDLVTKMATDHKELLDLYAAYFSKLSDTRWPWCNTNCKLDLLCRTVITVLWDRRKCNELVDMYLSSK